MAELVDALVSNTSVSNDVPVRPRLWVLRQKASDFQRLLFLVFFLKCLFWLIYNTILRLIPVQRIDSKISGIKSVYSKNTSMVNSLSTRSILF